MAKQTTKTHLFEVLLRFNEGELVGAHKRMATYTYAGGARVGAPIERPVEPIALGELADLFGGADVAGALANAIDKIADLEAQLAAITAERDDMRKAAPKAGRTVVVERPIA